LDPWAPQYLALGQPLYDCVDLGPGLTIKVSDLGAGNNSHYWRLLRVLDVNLILASWAADPADTTVTPLGLRAPELIFKQKFNTSIDIWSYGCLIYEFLTAKCLFAVWVMGDDENDSVEDADDEHLLNLNDIIQPLPEHLL
jgi:serine/threonine protein kinase